MCTWPRLGENVVRSYPRKMVIVGNDYERETEKKVSSGSNPRAEKAGEKSDAEVLAAGRGSDKRGREKATTKKSPTNAGVVCLL